MTLYSYEKYCSLQLSVQKEQIFTKYWLSDIIIIIYFENANFLHAKIWVESLFAPG